MKRFLFITCVIAWFGCYNAHAQVVDGTTRVLDKTNCIPGTIDGNIDISSTGAATYNLPIQVSPGTKGLQPQLSIVYNSQSGNGLLGYGWNLAGLSYISRVNKSQYYDGLAAPVNMTTADALALDGARLISTGTNKFSPENKPYTSVEFNGTSYTVTTQDGMVMEYGGSVDSRFLAKNGTVPITWAISKITDVDGNYIQFIYTGGKTTGEYNISEIKYTGNGTTAPYNSIKFGYTTRTDINSLYVAGGEVKQSMLLNSIKVYNESTLSKDYSFTYYTDSYTKLNTIGLTADGVKFNPTVINWGTVADYSATITDANLIWGSPKNNKIYVGDLNGDGRSDIVRWDSLNNNIILPFKQINGTFNILPLQNYTQKGSNNYYVTTDNYSYSIVNISLVDWNNDGNDEVLIHYRQSHINNNKSISHSTETDNPSYVMYEETDLVYSYSYANQFSPLLISSVLSGCSFDTQIVDSEHYKYYYQDINNDGIMDRINTSNGTLVSFLGLKDLSIPVIKNIADIKFLDFDGDGQQEILFLTKDGNGSIYKYTKTNLQLLKNIPLGLLASISIGDFNGDGKSDILSLLNNLWKLNYSIGSDFYQANFPDNNAAYLCQVGDINNDGKSDILIESNGVISFLISNGLSFSSKGAITMAVLSDNSGPTAPGYIRNSPDAFAVFVDMNGTGQKQLIYLNGHMSSISTYKIIKFNNRLDNNLRVNNITNGLNSVSTFSYYTFQDNRTFSTTFPKPAFPLLLMREPLQLATNIKTVAGGIITSNINYSFSDAYYHAQGKGFLGFKNIVVNNLINKTVSTSNFNLTVGADGLGLFYPWLANQTITRDGVVISEVKNITLTLYGGDIAKKYFYPLITNSTTADKQTGFIITNTIDGVDALKGRVTSQTSSTSDGWVKKIKTDYTTISGNKSRLTSITTTNSKDADTYSTTSTFAYDATLPFRLITKTDEASYGSNKRTLITSIDPKLGYDKFGNVISSSVKTDDVPSLTRSSSCTYDSYGRFIVSSTDASGYTSSAIFRGSDGAPTSSIDINSFKTQYNYSSASGVYTKKTTLPDNNWASETLSWDKDATGLFIKQKTSSAGDKLTEYFNAAGQKTKEVSLGFNSLEHSTSYSYYPSGLLYTVTNPAGKVTTYTYTQGRIATEKGMNLDNTYVYLGNKVTVTDNLSSRSQTNTIDALGNTTKTEATTGNVTYAYNAMGRVVSVTPISDKATTMKYDPLGNQIELNDPDAGITTYTYNGFGQLLTQKDAKQQIMTCKYDGGGRLNSRTLSDGSVYVYTYKTDAGKLNILDNITYTDAAGRKVKESYPSIDGYNRITQVKTEGDSKTFTTSYSYDAIGRVSSISYPSGLKTEYLYDGVSNLRQINQVKDDGSKSKIWTGDTQNELDQWKQFSLGNGLVTQWNYDTNYQLSSIKTGTTAGGTSIQNLGYTINGQGQLTNRTDGNLSEDFGYDALDRLTSSSVKGKLTQSYNYLSNGNIDNTSWAGKYSYNVVGHIHAINSVDGVTGSATSPSINTTSTYNVENKVLNIENVADSKSVYKSAFSYGVNGNRFKVDFFTNGTANSSISSKIYVGNSEFGYGTQAYKRTIITAPTGVCAVYQDSASTKKLYYIHTDNQGSWVRITDDAGSLKNKYSYDAWGRPRNADTWELKPISTASALVDLNSMQPRFDRGYTGHEVMAGFGLINMNGRLYDPYLQRFLSPDNVVQDPSNAQNYNRYSYCLNNPLRYTDPTGWQSVAPFYPPYTGWPINPRKKNVSPYSYEWITETYINSSGEVVPFDEVYRYYVLPNAAKDVNAYILKTNYSLSPSYYVTQIGAGNIQIKKFDALVVTGTKVYLNKASSEEFLPFSIALNTLFSELGEAALISLAKTYTLLAVLTFSGDTRRQENPAMPGPHIEERGVANSTVVEKAIISWYDDGNINGDNGGGNNWKRWIMFGAASYTGGYILNENTKKGYDEKQFKIDKSPKHGDTLKYLLPAKTKF